MINNVISEDILESSTNNEEESNTLAIPKPSDR
jgi:hypothetical protein